MGSERLHAYMGGGMHRKTPDKRGANG